MKLISKYVMTQMLMRGGGNSTRWVWTLNGMSYGVIPVADVVSGSVINLKITTPTGDIGVNDSIFWSESGNDCFCRISTDGTLAFGGGTVSFDGVPVSFGFPVPLDGARHTIEFTANVTAGIKFLGVRNTLGEHYTGKILSFRATGITNTNYPSGTFNYKLDEPYSDDHIAVDSDNEDGVELVVNGDFDTPDSWVTGAGVSIANGGCSFLNVGRAGNPLYQNIGVVDGVSFVAEVTIVNYVSGNLAAWLGGAQSNKTNVPVSGNGTHKILLPSGVGVNGNIIFGTTDSGSTFDIESLSVKQTTAMQKFNDLPEDYTEEAV